MPQWVPPQWIDGYILSYHNGTMSVPAWVQCYTMGSSMLFCASKGSTGTGVVLVLACTTAGTLPCTCVDHRITYLVLLRKHVRIQLETLTTLGKVTYR